MGHSAVQIQNSGIAPVRFFYFSRCQEKTCKLTI